MWEGILYCPTWDINNYIYYFNLIPILTLDKFKSHQRIGPHDINILSFMLGSLLGDSHLEKRINLIGSRLKVVLCHDNVEYLMWFHKFYSERGYCSPIKPKLYRKIKKKGKVFFCYKFNTYTYSSFNWIHDFLYKWDSDNHQYLKIISNILYLFTPMAWAIWFMNNSVKPGNTARIATNGLTLEEVNILCLTLKNKFNINTTLKKSSQNQGYIIYINKDSMTNFANLIKPHMIKSLYYKLGNY